MMVSEKFFKIIVCAILLNVWAACSFGVRNIETDRRFIIGNGETVKIKDSSLEIKQLTTDILERDSLIPLCRVLLQSGNVKEQKDILMGESVKFAAFEIAAADIVINESCDLKVTRLN